MPLRHQSKKYKALVKLLEENPINMDTLNQKSFCRDDTKVVSKNVLERMKKENILYKITNNFKS